MRPIVRWVCINAGWHLALRPGKQIGDDGCDGHRGNPAHGVKRASHISYRPCHCCCRLSDFPSSWGNQDWCGGFGERCVTAWNQPNHNLNWVDIWLWSFSYYPTLCRYLTDACSLVCIWQNMKGSTKKNLLWCRSLSANVRRANGFVCHQQPFFCLEISKYIGTMTSNRVAHATSIALPCTWLQQEFSPSLFLQTLFPLFRLFWGEILRRLQDHRFLRGVWHISTLKRRSGWDGCQEGLDLNIGGVFVARRSLHTLFLPLWMDTLVPLGLQPLEPQTTWRNQKIWACNFLLHVLQSCYLMVVE